MSGGRSVGLEAFGFGLNVPAADPSWRFIPPTEGGGGAVIVGGSRTLHGRPSHVTGSFCEPNASATA
jgi:hypothetical protein